MQEHIPLPTDGEVGIENLSGAIAWGCKLYARSRDAMRDGGVGAAVRVAYTAFRFASNLKHWRRIKSELEDLSVSELTQLAKTIKDAGEIAGIDNDYLIKTIDFLNAVIKLLETLQPED